MEKTAKEIAGERREEIITEEEIERKKERKGEEKENKERK